MSNLQVKSTQKITMLFTIMAIVFSFNAQAQIDCTSIPNTSMCMPPATFDFQTVQDGSWNSADTWMDGNVPSTQNNSNQQIRISHNVYLSNDNIKLLDDAVLYVVGDNSSLTVMNGNLYLEGSGSKAILENTVLRTSANIEQKGNTTICMTDVDLSVGEEQVGEDFVSGSSSTSANFQTDGGFTRLERVCGNITGNYSSNGDAYIINSSIDIGDRGNADKAIDGSDSGDLKNESGTMYIMFKTILL